MKVRDHCSVCSGTLIREGAEVGDNCDLDAFYVGYRARLGDGVRMAHHSSVGDRDNVHFETQARVGRNATVEQGTTLGVRTHVHAAANVAPNVAAGRTSGSERASASAPEPRSPPR